MRCVLISFVLLLGVISTNAQRAPKVDSVHMLLLNPYVQIEATKAINQLYNFKFDSSMQNMKYLKYEYGWHPLPYFLMGLNYWWRIQPDINNTQHDETFLAYMDTAIFVAKRLYDEANPIEGTFFLAASYGFRARLSSDREQYRKAALDGRKALKYLRESQEYTEYSPELLFGDGLINYYSKWIRENYPWLRPIMLFFPSGDKELGVTQLREVSRNAFYSRTEAQYYLLNILFHDHSNYTEARQLSEYLYDTYPDNAFFHRWHAQVLYQIGARREAEAECLKIIQRIDSAQVGYGDYTGRYAAFFLGRIYRGRRDEAKSEAYFERSREFHERANATEKGYYHQTLIHLAEFALKRDDKKLAREYFKKAKKLADRKDYAYKEAKKALKDM